MTFRNIVVFVLDLEGDIKKYDTDDGEPKKFSKQPDFFHSYISVL